MRAATIWTRWARCRSCCRRKARRYRWARSRASAFPKGSIRSAATTASAASLSRPMCAATIWEASSPKRKARSQRKCNCRQGSFNRMGRAVRESASCIAAIVAGHPYRLRGDLRHLVRRLARVPSGDCGLFGNPLGARGRRVRARAVGTALLGVGSGRLHRAGGRRRFERPRRDDRDQPADRGRAIGRAALSKARSNASAPC
jgi:hypothetical protein